MAIEGIGGPSSLGYGGRGGIEHVVQKGDTLESVAEQYGISTDALLSSNPQLKGSTELQAGMVLEIIIPRDAASLPASGFQQADTIEQFQPGLAVSQPIITPPLSPLRSVSELKIALTPDQFQINDEGHLLIRNNSFTQLFQELKSLSPGDDLAQKVRESDVLAYKLRPTDALSKEFAPADAISKEFSPAETLSFKFAPAVKENVLESDPLTFKYLPGVALGVQVEAGDALMEKSPNPVGDGYSYGIKPGEDALTDQPSMEVAMQDFHINELGEVVIANDQITKLFQDVLGRQNLTEAKGISIILSSKSRGE